METLDYYILEALNKEWTAFLNTFPWNSGLSIPESNRVFEARRRNWMRRMKKKHEVTQEQLNHYYVHD